MKFTAIPVSMAVLMFAAGAQAMEAPQTRDTLAADIQLAAETHDQKCNRWASIEGLKGAEHAEYVKYCMIDLSIPEKADTGGDD